MNQDRLTSFLKFTAQHQLRFASKPNDRINFSYCLDISNCLDCCLKDNSKDCHNAELNKKELEYLKLNYPEYFI